MTENTTTSKVSLQTKLARPVILVRLLYAQSNVLHVCACAPGQDRFMQTHPIENGRAIALWQVERLPAEAVNLPPRYRVDLALCEEGASWGSLFFSYFVNATVTESLDVRIDAIVSDYLRQRQLREEKLPAAAAPASQALVADDEQSEEGEEEVVDEDDEATRKRLERNARRREQRAQERKLKEERRTKRSDATKTPTKRKASQDAEWKLPLGKKPRLATPASSAGDDDEDYTGDGNHTTQDVVATFFGAEKSHTSLSLPL